MNESFKKENLSLVLSGDDVNTIVENIGLDILMDILIERLTEAIEQYNPKTIEIPIRSGFNYTSENPGLIEWMPIHHKGDEVVIKVVGYHPQNPKKFKLPTILSSISSYDTRTGHLKGIADGVLLTALRTGAASAVASKFMARPDSTILGLIGCGAQSITQLHAISRLFAIETVLVYDVDEAIVQSFNERISVLDLGINIIISTIAEIVATSDILCTETSIEIGEGPLFNNVKTKGHLHINAIGSDFPGKTELPLGLLKRSFVCPDFLEQAKIEGECQQLEDDDIGTDWVHLIQNYESYTHLKSESTVFDSTGWALEDQVVMDLFLELAHQFNIGTELGIENIPEDAKNPYHFLMKTVRV